MIEEWKDIPGYEGLYEVSNTGFVRNKKRNKLLKGFIDRNGYKIVLLSYKGQKHFSVHRLVAEVFIPNINNSYQVNHKDEDKTNNNVDNLEWCDCKYNINYGLRTKKVKKKQIETGYWLGWDRKEYLSIYKQYIGVKRKRKEDADKLKLYEEYRNRKRKKYSNLC